MMLLEINSLSYSYKNNQKVLKDINLKIKEGTINVLLGLNGCGKTTLLKLIACLLKTETSQIFINGKSINELKNHERAKLISYVPQLSNNEEDFIVKDFLLFGFVSDLKFYEKPKQEQIERVYKAAVKFDIKSLLNKKLNELSGGERQKVYICSAYLQDTPLILLDEPMSALDLRNQSLITGILNELRKEGKTIILSTHNPNIALILNSNVILMNNGEIYRFGYCKDIVKIDLLKEIYGDKLISTKEVDYDEVTISR